MPRPIGRREFYNALIKCKPPGVSWPSKFDVAFSGGIDSTCLLFLLARLIRNPQNLVAHHVDHSFQADSRVTALRCKTNAEIISSEIYCRRLHRRPPLKQQFRQKINNLPQPGVTPPYKDITARVHRIPWSKPPYPSRPQPGSALEEIGRNARYHIIQAKMTSPLLFLGHHLNDQVETALMRFRRSSTAIGLSGMRRVRRLGMGEQSRSSGESKPEIGFYGSKGMEKWICRPLLQFPKTRLEATLRSFNIPWIEDASNKDATLTPRNAIRASLSQESIASDPVSSPEELSKEEKELISSLPVYFQLRDRVDKIVDKYISRVVLPSPISSIEFTAEPLLEDDLVRHGFLLRIMRYVSPFPWGSVKAEGGRNHGALKRLEAAVWPDKTSLTYGNAVDPIAAGGETIWRQIGIAPGSATRWRVTRAPPESRYPIRVDLTDELSHKSFARGSPVSISCFDNRFNISFLKRSREFAKLRSENPTLKVNLTLGGQYSLPRLVIVSEEMERILWKMPSFPISPLNRGDFDDSRTGPKEWNVHYSYLRLLDAI